MSNPTPPASFTFEDYLYEQRKVLHSIRNSVSNVTKLGKSKVTLALVQNRLGILKEHGARIKELDRLLYKAATADQRKSHEYYTQDECATAEEAFFLATDTFSEWIAQLSSKTVVRQQETTPLSHSGPSDGTSANIRLPKIDIPRFKGRYTDWISFRDIFVSLIHENSTIGPVQKFHYLKGCLEGEPAALLKSVSLTAANYDSAWHTLVSRYENNRMIISAHLSAIFGISECARESSVDLKRLYDTVMTNLDALKNLKCPTQQWDHVIVHLIVQRLDARTRKDWELSLGASTTYPELDELTKFLQSRIKALEIMSSLDKGNKVTRSTHKTSRSHLTADSVSYCPICKGTHIAAHCDTLKRQTIEQRIETARDAKCCFNCLRPGHLPRQCKSKYRCAHCRQPHHTLLHRYRNVSQSAGEPLSTSGTSVVPHDVFARPCAGLPVANVATSVHLAHDNPRPRGTTILGTARVIVQTYTGQQLVVRALIDPCSEDSFISESLVQMLRLPRRRVHVSVSGLGGGSTTIIKSSVTLTMYSPNQGDWVLTVDTLVSQLITSYKPPCMSRTHLKSWPHIDGLTLADPCPFAPDQFDVLLGANCYAEIMLSGLHKGPPGTPIAQLTVFGWLLTGTVLNVNSTIHRTASAHHLSLLDLSHDIKRFWEIEEIPQVIPLTPDEQFCEDHFRQTHSRRPDGKYVVRLPFKTELPLAIGNSLNIAERQFTRLERRLAAHTKHKKLYDAFLIEYETLGHMRRLPSPSESSSIPHCYLPHHPVIRESSTTTRLRVVFNASSATSNGASLNSQMFTGPKLQTDLPSILLKWRMFRFAMCADICKMYRQIWIDERDVNYQRILWRSDPTQSLDAYQLLTVTYGTASAPFLALRVMQQLACDEEAKYPVGAQIVREHFYVDDVLFGADDLRSAHASKLELQRLLSVGGFTLSKWASNEPSLCRENPMANEPIATKDHHSPDTIKVLGVTWHPHHDSFCATVNLPSDSEVTKRSILSLIARMYDPLGLLAPVTVYAKIIMQELWLSKVDWDQEIPANLQAKWSKYCDELHRLTTLQIPCWTQFHSSVEYIELHGFCDASSKAYAALVYLKIKPPDQLPRITLMYSKSRVAPLKQLSIPRLELCAAELLSRALNYVQTVLKLRSVSVHAWTDSTIVLTWISQQPSKWQTFVANRVSLIQSRLPDVQWRHVVTSDNPADSASRGLTAHEYLQDPHWWSGPPWLSLAQDFWPTRPTELKEDEVPENRIAKERHVHLAILDWTLPHRYSSWTKTIRITARCRQFLILSQANKPHDDAQFAAACAWAKRFWLQYIQQEVFADEKAALASDKPLAKQNRLVRLNPFIDEDGFIRVGGRLGLSTLPYDEKHPIIFSKHRLTTLLIDHVHQITLHGGAQLMTRTIRQHYWILQLRTQVRACIRRCIRCERLRAETPVQRMGDLPEHRITRSSRPFLHCGVDYAGPVDIKRAKGRGHQTIKVYICLFVCLAVRAIHLELVSDCTTEGFLAAFKRFISRRGKPAIMYSDHGRNFQGAKNELQRQFQAILRNPDLISIFAVDEIQWHFIPPNAPHFGGIWEAGVKSVKHHLRRVMGHTLFTYEELSTLLTQIEACLNSRPIAPLSDDPECYDPLTPGHFLVGSSLIAVPEQSLLDVHENRLSRWQLMQQKLERFWRLWSHDYLNTLQQRNKWQLSTRNFKIHEIVLIRNPNLPPTKWALGRIIECHTGPDGHVRVLTVKTADTTLTRPISKVVRLPIPIDPENSSE